MEWPICWVAIWRHVACTVPLSCPLQLHHSHWSLAWSAVFLRPSWRLLGRPMGSSSSQPPGPCDVGRN
eukprot:4172102-Karenia_brevis.AAC.1